MLARALLILGRQADALTVAKRCVTDINMVARLQPRLGLPLTAAAFETSALAHSELGEHDQAVATAERAVAALRRLGPNARPSLVDGLIAQGQVLDAASQREAADHAYEEATAILRELATEQSSSMPQLASQLIRLAERRSAADDAAALALADEAAAIARRSTGPGEQLARALGVRARALLALDRPEEAIAASREQISALRRAGSRSGAFLEPLRLIADAYGDMHRHEAAVSAWDERVAVLRTMAADDDRYEPLLAGSLRRRGGELMAAGRHDEARRDATEALAIFRRLAMAQSGGEPDGEPGGDYAQAIALTEWLLSQLNLRKAPGLPAPRSRSAVTERWSSR